ncbi:MAG TPA: RNA chaperone Hfq [Verrucomicrobiae bacterium]|jgi:host factor-I protein|nr:RNA chaperone Hfq [Verrucomicrobiae bacterium]
MKEAIDSANTRQASEKTSEDFVSRKLIRPSLGPPPPRTEPVSERRERLERTDRMPANVNKRTPPPEQTHAENFYYQKQMQSKTPVVVVLKDGEEVQGLIDWYDRNCIKLVRDGASTLLVYKPAIRYIYKAGEARQS